MKYILSAIVVLSLLNGGCVMDRDGNHRRDYPSDGRHDQDHDNRTQNDQGHRHDDQGRHEPGGQY